MEPDIFLNNHMCICSTTYCIYAAKGSKPIFQITIHGLVLSRSPKIEILRNFWIGKITVYIDHMC